MFYNLAFRWRCHRYHAKAGTTPLLPLYDRAPPDPAAFFDDSTLTVIDCEMTGLQPARDQLLSIGWVVIEQGRISHNSARHLLIHAEGGAGNSSRIHGLTDTRIAGARSAATALLMLVQQAASSVLVFHHAALDLAFLQKSARENFRCPLLFAYVDTMEIERRRLNLQDKSASLRLPDCRARYGLPPVTQHHALADAQSTAELLLAQAAYLRGKKPLRLRDLGLRCA